MKLSKEREQVRASAVESVVEEERCVRPSGHPAELGTATATVTRPQRARSSFADVCTDMYAKARGDLIWD